MPEHALIDAPASARAVPPAPPDGRDRRPQGPTRLLSLHEIGPGELTAWRELAAEAVEPNPFFEPECVMPAARRLGQSKVRLLIVEDSGRNWLACMPITRRVTVGHRRLPGASGWRHRYSFLGTPLVRDTDAEPAAERLLAGALKLSPLSLVALPWLGDDGPVAGCLHAALEGSGLQAAASRAFERAIVTREIVAEDAHAMIGPRHRRDLRRLGRRLAEELGGELETRDESQRAGAVDDFLALESSGWKGRRGTAFSSIGGHADFFTELCDNFRAAGRLQLLSLGGGGRTVSYKCNLIAGDAVFCFKIAFDESFSRYRPGLQLELRMLELFRDQMSHGWMDSCAAPDSEMFRRIWPQRRRLCSYVVARNRPLAWAIGRAAQRRAGETTEES